MQIKEITNYLESLSPLGSQESYDNSGLICGDKNWELTNALISLDCLESTVDEAIQKGCNLIISHHPIVFKGLKKINGSNYIERVLISAIKHDIALYAIHTNLDNYKLGVNKKIGDLLGVKHPKILAPASQSLEKLSVFTPVTHQDSVLNALFDAGAGHIGNYSECSFSSEGNGSFKANEKAAPHVGEKNQRHYEPEVKLEVLMSTHRKNAIIQAMLSTHPYESVAYDIVPINNLNYDEGSGMYGELDKPLPTLDFLKHLKSIFNCGVIRHTNIHQKNIKKVAWCGGSGSFLLPNAKGVDADIYITGDFKYHEFFDAENKIIIADIGHFESEQFTIELIHEILSKKFTTFAAYLTESKTNPVNYF